MFKPPKSHGLDRKYKPWRKGKSQKAQKKGSLKQQLRGLERLLSKLTEDQTDLRNELQQKIRDIKAEIDVKQNSLQEKKNAEKAHAPRFLDRQRLTRKEKKERNGKNRKSELYKLALDEVYVAHHPNDVKYMPLFQKGQRVVDQSRQLYRRAVTRKRILKTLSSSSPPAPCNWIAKDQYDRLPKDWTIQDEENTFGGSISRKDIKQKKALQTDDSRFTMVSKHDVLLQAADEVETELDKTDNVSGSSKKRNLEEMEDDSSSSSDSDDDQPEMNASNVTNSKESDSGSSSSSDSSDDSDSDEQDTDVQEAADPKETNLDSADDSDSTSSSSSSSSDSAEDDAAEDNLVDKTVVPSESTRKAEQMDVEVDDFLIDAEENRNDPADIFHNASTQLPALTERGDKSKGWQTQRQRPGQYKKRRVRR
eukprot:scaffold20053_cov117-Cylindrotheca_fusiformis.AAC.3